MSNFYSEERARPGDHLDARLTLRSAMEAGHVPAEVIEARMEALAGRPAERAIAVLRKHSERAGCRRLRPARQSVLTW